MTKELKTLKDINFNEVCHPNSNYSTREEFIKFKLKALTIKWIKEEISIKINEKLPAPEYEVRGKIFMEVFYSLDIQRWMKRFNLTEEDLK